MLQGDVIGLGSLNWDLIYELPCLDILKGIDISVLDGEEISLDEAYMPPLLDLLNTKGIKRSESGGGQAANTVFALTKMGFKTGLIGTVGQDMWGDNILAELKGVNNLLVRRGGKSSICVSILTPEKERTMILFPGSNSELKSDEVSSIDISKYSFLHLTSFAKRGPLEVQAGFISGLSKDTLISIDPGNLYAELGLDILMPIIKRAYCVFATDNELEKLTGLSLEDAILTLIKLGVELVICKKGAKGASLHSKGKEYYFPPLDVEVKDVTGAGDCFAAGFLAGLIKGLDLEKSGRLGTIAASLCIQDYGRDSYPDSTIFMYLSVH